MDYKRRALMLAAPSLLLSGCAGVAVIAAAGAGGGFFRCELDENQDLPISRQTLRCDNGRVELAEIRKAVLIDVLESANAARSRGLNISNERIARVYESQLQTTLEALEEKRLETIDTHKKQANKDTSR